MRLSIIFELLLIFLLIAFAAYGRVIDSNGRAVLKKLSSASLVSNSAISLKQATENVNKYCVCNENICNCCRDFHIPLVQLSGPGCASLQYLQENKLAMQLSIGDNILSSNIVNGNNPKPVCVTLPGGFSKFCGKIYSIKKEADKHFKACLGLELRSASELEASLRVSCFRFGPDGLKLRPAEPLPPTLSIPSSTTDDDYDDIFSLDDDDEDDDDDDDEETETDDSKVTAQTSSSSLAAAEQEQNQEQGVEEDDDDDDDDLLGFSALLDIFTSDDDSTSKKKTKPTLSTTLPSSFTIPIIALTSTSSPSIESHSNSSPATTLDFISNKEPTTSASSTPRPHSTTASLSNHDGQKISTEKLVETTSAATTISNDENINADETRTTIIGITESSSASLDTEKITANSKKSKINSTETKLADKKKAGSVTKLHDTTKITKLATKPQTESTPVDNSSESVYDDENDENDDDDEDDAISDEINSDEKQSEAVNESDKTVNAADADTSAGNDDYDHSYEESDEDEDADVEVVSTLLEDEVSTEKTDRRKDKVKTNKVNSKKEPAPTRSDYDYELSEILGRKYSNDASTSKGVKTKNNPKSRLNEK